MQHGVLNIRKGPQEAIEAFQRAFPHEDDVRLMLKTRNGAFGDRLEGFPAFADRRIIGIDAIWSRAELLALLHQSDAFIWLSRGEGFGFPPLQAALTGLPVVMTTHSGMETYYEARYFYGVPSIRLIDSLLGGQWYEPSVEHAAAQLRKIYEDRAEARQRGQGQTAFTSASH